MDKDIKTYKGYRMLIFIAYLFMATFGFIETIKGIIIPSIRVEFLVDYTQIGQMLFLSSLGYLITAFFGGIAIERFGIKKIFILGSIVTIISTGLFSRVSNFSGVVVIYLLLGVGFACFEGINTLASKIFIKNEAMMMNLMHFFFGVGSVIAPRYAGKFLQTDYSWKWIYQPAMILMIGILIIIIFTKFPTTKVEQIGETISLNKIVKTSKIWILAIVLGFFNIMELGIVNWLVNYLQVERSLDVINSTTYLTGFFVAFTVGRLGGGIIADKVGYVKSLFYFTAMATITIFGGLMLGSRFIFLFSMAGFFISILFPTMLLVIMKEYTYGVSKVIAFTITICGLMSMVANWLIGKISDLWGVGVGMGNLVVCGVSACILLLILTRQARQPM